MNFRIHHVIVLAGLLGGCGVALYTPTADDVAEGTTLARLHEGRALYVAKCGSCHTLKLPSEHSPPVWRENLDEMQDRARITDAEKELMFEYLAAGSKQTARSLQLEQQKPTFVKSVERKGE